MNGVDTITEAYASSLLLRRLGMTKWVAVPKPVAELELDLPAEHTDTEGNVVTHFKTKFGVRYARVVEPSGFVLWLQEVPA
jgi:hypothetical protein